MNRNPLIPLFASLAIVAIASFSNGQAQQFSESQMAQILKRFPEADTNGDGKLSAEEFEAARQQSSQSRQGNPRSAAAVQTALGLNPGWDEDEFPPHAVSLKTPDEIMAIYKKGEAGRTYAGADAMSFPKSADGAMRIVGTGHSFTAPGYRTLPAITRAAGFEQPLCLHNGGGATGTAHYKWEQENGIFGFDGKPLPKLLAAISNAEWEAMIWGHGPPGARPEFYTCWIDFCRQYNPNMKFFLTDAWPQLQQVSGLFNLKANPETEAFFTNKVFDRLAVDRNTAFASLVNVLRDTTDDVYIVPTHDAMTEAAKRFKRGELPGVEGLHKLIGGQERSIWKDQIGHLGPGFDRLEGYVFYATLYGKSPELISEPIKFKGDQGFPSADLDKIFREIAWKAVVGHPLSGVTDKNRNGIGDHME